MHAERCGQLCRERARVIERRNALADSIGYAMAKRQGAGSHGDSAECGQLRSLVGEAIEQGPDGVADVVRAKRKRHVCSRDQHGDAHDVGPEDRAGIAQSAPEQQVDRKCEDHCQHRADDPGAEDLQQYAELEIACLGADDADAHAGDSADYGLRCRHRGARERGERDKEAGREQCHEYRKVGKPAVREEIPKLVGRRRGVVLFINCDFGDYDALADGLHDVMSLQGAAEDYEYGHQQRGRAIGNDLRSNCGADAIGRIIGTDIPAHIESCNQQGNDEEDVH